MTKRDYQKREVSLWPPSFDAAIFDFDGTIAETAHLWQLVDEAFLGSRGIPLTDDYARALAALGFERGAIYTIERYGLDDRPEDVVEEWSRLSQALYKTKVTLKPGARHYILSLRRRGIPCALATSNEAHILDTMEHVSVDDLFDVRVHGNEVNAPKSEPDIYLEAARRLGAAPERCIVFEDLAAGIRSARSAGFMTCAVDTEDPSHSWEEVSSLADIGLLSWEGLAE